ncbi:MAG: hypothetical protein O7G85_17580 [Planctomycetota bacterium]|nr:hypothetical protein [Planctomycetota bacterium]
MGADETYVSKNDLDLHYRLGDTEVTSETIIRRPDGVEERFESVTGDRVVRYKHEFDTRPITVVEVEWLSHLPSYQSKCYNVVLDVI